MQDTQPLTIHRWRFVAGRVHGFLDLKEGKVIQTSLARARAGKDLVHTKNSIYRLGDPMTEFAVSSRAAYNSLPVH